MEETSDFSVHFDPEWYLNAYHSFGSKNGMVDVKQKFVLDSLHEMFTSGIEFGDRLLDVGTGPTVWSVLSASRHVKHIDLSDYTPKNLSVLKDWTQRSRNHDKNELQYEMDLADDRRSTGVREEEVRSKVKAIHHIDVRKENIFLEPNCNPLLYDVITTCFCCESASKFKEIYKTSIKNVANLLKSGGYLCMFGVLEQNSYRVRNFRFPSVNVKTEDIQSTITEIGFEILELKTLFNDEEFTSNTLTDSKNIYALFAKKL